MIAFVLTFPTTVCFLSVLDYWYIRGVSKSLCAVIQGCTEQTEVLRMLAKAEGAHKHVKRSAGILVVCDQWQWFGRHHPVLTGWQMQPTRSCDPVTMMLDPCRRDRWGWWRIDPWWLTFSWCIINCALQHGCGRGGIHLQQVVGTCLAQCPASLLPPWYAEKVQVFMEVVCTDVGTFATVCSLYRFLPLLSIGHLNLVCQVPDRDMWHKSMAHTTAGLVCTQPDDDHLGMWDWVVRFADDSSSSLLSLFVKRYLQLEAAHRCTIPLYNIYNTWYFVPSIASEIGKQGTHAKVARTLCHGMVRKKVTYIWDEFTHSGRTVPAYCSVTMDDATGYFHLALFHSPRQMHMYNGWSCARAAQWLTRSHAGRAAVNTGLVDPYRGSKGPPNGNCILYYAATTCQCDVTDMWHLCVLQRLLDTDRDSCLSQLYQRRHGCRHPMKPNAYMARQCSGQSVCLTTVPQGKPGKIVAAQCGQSPNQVLALPGAKVNTNCCTSV